METPLLPFIFCTQANNNEQPWLESWVQNASSRKTNRRLNSVVLKEVDSKDLYQNLSIKIEGGPSFKLFAESENNTFVIYSQDTNSFYTIPKKSVSSVYNKSIHKIGSDCKCLYTIEEKDTNSNTYLIRRNDKLYVVNCTEFDDLSDKGRKKFKAIEENCEGSIIRGGTVLNKVAIMT